MATPKVPPLLLAAEASVHSVDLVEREIRATIKGMPAIIYAPPGCRILLRGELVKLRMMQPRDRIRFTFVKQSEVLIAQAIEMLPDAILNS